jgi:hypothetical protein
MNRLEGKNMKKLITCVICGTIGLHCIADEVKQSYTIQRGEEMIVVNDVPTVKISEPISNSFVYIDGEYIEPPYIVSISNLSVRINGRIARNFEPYVKTREWYLAQPFKRVGITPEDVGETVTWTYEYYVRRLQKGMIAHIVGGGPRISADQRDGDGGGLGIVQAARKAMQGDEKAKQALIASMGLENSLAYVHPDWIERLANNTNLETRATVILEAKREKERQERERREQMNKK